MVKRLFTIGYEGINIETFVSVLKSHSIQCLIDVREIPLSRKPGFSKSSLSDRLNRDKITYVHFKELGSPKQIRNELKATKDYCKFFLAMDKYLAQKQKVVEQAYEYLLDSISCLMCFEEAAETCHRKIVAKKIKETDGNGLQIVNI